MDEILHLTNYRRYYHPFPIFLCFLSLIILLVLIPHPVITTISLIVSGLMLAFKRQWQWRNFFFSMVIYLLIVVTNPIFVTKGATVLFNFFGAPYTLEALYYGIVFANMVMSLFWWCLIFNPYLTSDHIVYLFSKPFKVVALIIAIVFRLIPKFKRQIHQITLYQKKYSSSSPLKKGLDSLLIMVTWAFENSLTMVDSMNARGYQSQRSHFHLFKFNSYDLKLSLFMLLIDGGMLLYYFIDFSNYYFYPKIKPIAWDIGSLISYMGIVLLMLVPALFKKEA